jgi:hypothetical protein
MLDLYSDTIMKNAQTISKINTLLSRPKMLLRSYQGRPPKVEGSVRLTSSSSKIVWHYVILRSVSLLNANLWNIILLNVDGWNVCSKTLNINM